MVSTPLRVLISHTQELADHPAGGSFVAAVLAATTRAGMLASEMEYFAVRDETPAAVCVRQVAASDVVIGLLGMRYGSPVPGRTPPVSYTELEFEAATEFRIPRLMFLLDERMVVPLPPAELVDRRYGELQDAFRTRVTEAGLVTGRFATPEQLGMLVFQALTEHARDRTAAEPAEVGWRRRSRYVAQVRDIAPADGLQGREAELNELAAWCSGGEPYVWWQAPPWAGKSALMATFALRPPPDVQVVSYFVTGRLAAQSDSAAFGDALIEQLAVLTGEGVPSSLTPSQRDTYRRDLLGQAAAQLAERGQRLVLLVDGLDEDAGGGPGSGLPSIASVMPKHIPDGLRVIVASRPGPDLPADVPADHPLRRCRRRLLDSSPYAAEVARLARRELDELLTTDVRQRDLLGFLTAAGGGLTGPDLTELTGLPIYEIDSMLGGLFGRTVVGRTETSLARDRRVYLFAHETLRAEAIGRLGVLVDGYRSRIHAWLAGYRTLDWPAGTPAYALTGYFPMLTEAGDLARMVDLACDPRRHDRMMDVTGGDAAALTEIRTVQSLALSAPEFDLASAARLSVHRTVLTDRNTYIPALLPAVWARLGHATRAEALAFGISTGKRRARALHALVVAFAETGDLDRAVAVAGGIGHRTLESAALSAAAKAVVRMGDLGRAEALAYGADGTVNPEVMRSVMVAAAKGGFSDRAEAIAREMRPSYRRADFLATLIKVSAPGGDLDRAERIARSLDDPLSQVQGLAAVIKGCVARGLADRSRALVAAAEALISDIPEVLGESTAWGALAGAVDACGDLDRATTMAERAEQLARGAVILSDKASLRLAALYARRGEFDRAVAMARGIIDPSDQARGLRRAVRMAAVAGEYERAEDIASLISDPNSRERALHVLIEVAASRRDFARAEAAARSGDVFRRPKAVRALVKAIADWGDVDRAEIIARRYADPSDDADEHRLLHQRERFRPLDGLARSLARSGDFDRAQAIASSIDPSDAANTLRALAVAIARSGDLDRAELITRSIIEPYHQARAMRALAQAAGDLSRGRILAEDAERVARTLSDPAKRWDALNAFVGSLAGTGNFDRAEEVARRISSPALRSTALATFVQTAVARGIRIERAEAVIQNIDDDGDHDQSLRMLAVAAAKSGHLDHAEAVAHQIMDSYLKAEAFGELGPIALLRNGDVDSAVSIVLGAVNSGDEPGDLYPLVYAIADAGDADQARAFIRCTTDAYQQMWMLVKVAKTLIASGDRDGARAVVPDAESLIDRATPSRRVDVLSLFAELLARVGDFDRAEAVVGDIGTPAERANPILLLAEEIVDQTGDLERAAALASAAQEVAGGIDFLYDRDEAMSRLARVVARCGDIDRADKIAQGAGTSEHSAPRAWTALITWLVKNGRLDLAVAFAEDAPSRHWRNFVVDELVRAEVEHGDIARAEQIADDFTVGFGSNQGRRSLVEAVVRTGDLDRAETLSQHMHWDKHLVFVVARAVAKGADPDRAEAIIRLHSGPESLAPALAELAHAHAQSNVLVGDPRRRIDRLLAHAVLAGPWHLGLTKISELAPDIIPVIDEQLSKELDAFA